MSKSKLSKEREQRKRRNQKVKGIEVDRMALKKKAKAKNKTPQGVQMSKASLKKRRVKRAKHFKRDITNKVNAQTLKNQEAKAIKELKNIHVQGEIDVNHWVKPEIKVIPHIEETIHEPFYSVDGTNSFKAIERKDDAS